MATLEKYGFKPHGVSDDVSGAETEKTISCKVGPDVWNRWKRAQQRLAGYGDIQLATVVRNSFLAALEELEREADELESGADGSRIKGGASK